MNSILPTCFVILALFVQSSIVEYNAAHYVQAAIVNSQTLEEVARLEQALKSGQVPADLNIRDASNTIKNKNPIDNMVTDRENEAATDVPTDMEQG